MHIVLFGADYRLLDTRRMLLEQTGLQVAVASDLATLRRVSESDPVDLLLLCYTFTQAECDEALSLVRTFAPTAKHLTLTVDEWAPLSQSDGHMLSVMNGPRHLLDAIHRTLA